MPSLCGRSLSVMGVMLLSLVHLEVVSGTSLIAGDLHTNPEIPYSVTYESAMNPGDPRCEKGRGDFNGQVCCPRTCGQCGGTGCESRPGGAGECCESNIIAAANTCNDNEAPCVIEARLCLTGDCNGPAPPTGHGWAGGDKGTDQWPVPALAPAAPDQSALAQPATPPDNSCSLWTQYSSELQWSYVGHTQEQVAPHSQFPSNHIPISSRQACGTVYPRQGDAQDGMFPPGLHGNSEPDKLQQLYYNTNEQPATYCFHGGGNERSEYGIETQVQSSTSWNQVCIGINRETIGWPTATSTYNLYGVTSGLSTTSDFSLPLATAGFLNKEYRTQGGERLTRNPSAHSDYPHSAVDQSVHGANSGFIVHSGMKDQCHDTTLRNSCETMCIHDITATSTLPVKTQCTPCTLAQQCAPSSPLHEWTSQTLPSISGGCEKSGCVYNSLPQGGLGTTDTWGQEAPGLIRSGDNRRSAEY